MLYGILKAVVFICLLIAFSFFFYYMRKNKVIGRKIKEVHSRIDEASVKRSREWRRNIGIQRPKSFIEKCLEKPERRFIYSGIGRLFPGVTIEIWLMLLILSSACIYIISFIVTKALLMSLIIMCAYIGLIELMESLLILRNYKAVDSELLKFLNMLSNFSVTNGEITSVFLQISKFLREPLRTELEECYYDAYTSGDNKAALEALADQIEHPMFKETIRNLIICINYSANYKEVVSSSRKIIRDEQRAREERKSVAREAIVNMIIISCMLLVSLYIADEIISKSIWAILLYTVFGRFCAAIVVVVYLIFAWKVGSVDR